MLYFSTVDSTQPPARLDGRGVPELDLVAAWNQTARSYPRDACIHRLFEARAAETPNAVALDFEGRTLTYAQLDRKSNQLAHYLRRIGVGPEVLVAVSIDRSLEMVIALLGILKAGGAYLPLDQDAPPERVKIILADAAAPVIVTKRHRSDRLPEHSARVVLIDSDWRDIERETEESPAGAVTADNLAYVLFTSGSTGGPKGVLVEHRAVVRLVCNTDYVRLDADEVLLHMAPLAFDASTFEIWGALLNGAKLAIMGPHSTGPTEIGRAIARYGVTTLWLTAGLFHQMVETNLEGLNGVRQLLAGGDVLGVPHARRVLGSVRGCRLINGYGPTEGTTFSCCYPVVTLPLSAHTVPIGRPIANTRAYILDENGAPVKVGVQGELYLAGDGLARGYLNRPELTAGKFLPDPFWEFGLPNLESGSPNATLIQNPNAHAQGATASEIQNPRMYRTGDLARYLPDGNIEFLGRVDHQVKIRGYRVELDEITAALLEHPLISGCAFIALGEGAISKRLAAYVTVRHALPTTKELREFLGQRLPEYMVPSLFLQLEELPLTPNGKVDYAALPLQGGERLPSGAPYAAPASEMEHTVAGMWQEVLGVQRVGLHENFFDIGGDSLRLTQLHWKLQQATGIQFSVTALFQYTTVKSFAKYLHERSTASQAGTPEERPSSGDAEDRAARKRAAMTRWKKAANCGRKRG